MILCLCFVNTVVLAFRLRFKNKIPLLAFEFTGMFFANIEKFDGDNIESPAAEWIIGIHMHAVSAAERHWF